MAGAIFRRPFVVAGDDDGYKGDRQKPNDRKIGKIFHFALLIIWYIVILSPSYHKANGMSRRVLGGFWQGFLYRCARNCVKLQLEGSKRPCICVLGRKI